MFGQSCDEFSDVVDEPVERFDVLDILRGWPICDFVCGGEHDLEAL